jgi:hypothetical protein
VVLLGAGLFLATVLTCVVRAVSLSHLHLNRKTNAYILACYQVLVIALVVRSSVAGYWPPTLEWALLMPATQYLRQFGGRTVASASTSKVRMAGI